MTIKLDTDRALENADKDQFGFVGMAKRLAPSIVEASKSDGMVIGLEGPWGSGKTSLLNFLRSELSDFEDAGIYTITIAPWLNGDASPLVNSLLGPMSAKLKEKEIVEGGGNAAADKIVEAGNLIREYGPKTARSLASVANFAGYLVPGAQVVGEALGAGANAAEQLISSGPTPSDLKDKISKAIKDLDIGFVVILDDLDRLEPEQAVEVIRLVRSVADFPNVVYLMCYDREVLAQALKSGLQVQDGDLFLQKIVQLTFNIPLPEPFDLRSLFLKDAQALYLEVTGTPISKDLLADLRIAVDREGVGLATPREVKLALNSIRFIFPQVQDDVYFPDLCRLHLLKTTNFKLYKWLEIYPALRSVMMTGDASIPADEKAQLGKDLKSLLPAGDMSSTRSISSLRRFVPGLMDVDDEAKRVFNTVSSGELSSFVRLKRLSSPFHYRFYFALTGPKTVMPDEDFELLLTYADKNVKKLIERFLEEAQRQRTSNRTWFEHILNRLDSSVVSNLGKEQLSGILLALSEMMDVAMNEDSEYRALSLSLDQLACVVAKNCLQRLQELDPDHQVKIILKMASTGEALNWLIGKFFRDQLFKHGIVGNDAVPEDQREIPIEALEDAIAILKKRASAEGTKKRIPAFPNVSAYLYGWQNLSTNHDAKDWVQEYCKNDEGFLEILNHLRGWSLSDKVYYPLSKGSVEVFLDWDEVMTRLDRLKSGEHAEKVEELLLAISQSTRF